ncbi:TRAP transporter small permease [Sulfitobacter geojensis]|uniref:TRAP transporter small permease protein n=1 Tax=Sulfitobacter geojensis TaxID=1342299 RepID=A0AAE2W1Q5_9RHOB|nr:TRAP transporter small permease [Sulfitobacter geojensis]MBM1695385.1 TRAP transporter small permease [Sulfitobacter geojensis]MBM1707485.1 TRAP transporter small permease [Sulfitobacter geojensis]MBM1711608.1 TRAP transporter small permease [Sulfitobacter geojensis]MBM1715583.1 TRAP transporter small permease [Sulfitobacter geojensis]
MTVVGHSSKLAKLEAATDALRKACIFIASAALVLLVATFGWLVFGRYVLNVTPTWVEQLALLLVCYIAFLGAAAGVKENTHLGVSLFRDMMPVAVQKVFMIAIDLILAGFGLVMLIAGIVLMRFGWDTLLPMLDIPESFRTLAITSCGALIFLFSGLRALVRILSFSDWHTVPQDLEI